MSPRLALAKPLTGSGHGSGALKKKGDLLGRLFLMVQQAACSVRQDATTG